MSLIKIKYEILISGIYPFEGVFTKNGYTIVENVIDSSMVETAYKAGSIYMSPLTAYCCYPRGDGEVVYLTFQKEKELDIPYPKDKDYDKAFTNEHLDAENLFGEVDDLEKIMVLETNNNIKFPIKKVDIYDDKGNFITTRANFSKINIPSLLSANRQLVLETQKRQENRLSSGISYEKIVELKRSNPYFDNALAIYYSSFSVEDVCVSFALLTTSLEALLSLSTYSSIEHCHECRQPMYKIRANVSENVGLILRDETNTMTSRMKKLYDKRSDFLHNGNRCVEDSDLRELQEYTRKVLLMYWFIYMTIAKNDHKEIVNVFRSDDYLKNVLYGTFLTSLSNESFEERKSQIIKGIFDTLLKK